MPMSQRDVLMFVLFSGLILYVSGVATGWFIGQSYYKSAEEKLGALESDMLYLRTIAKEPDLCSYAKTRYLSELEKLQYFWEGLPYRLESANVPDEILAQYTDLEVEAYITGKMVKKACGGKLGMILYFFERNNENSTKAGEMLDKIKSGNIVLSFPVDIESPLVNSLLKDLNITKFPAIYLCNRTYTWPFNETELEEVVEKCRS